jgi:hypothetical protein
MHGINAFGSRQGSEETFYASVLASVRSMLSPVKHAVCAGRQMKTETEVYSLIQRLYADSGRDSAEIVRVRPLYGGWYNALKYEVVRADGTVTAIRRKDVEDSNYDAMADALKTFAIPRAQACSCRHCGKWMHAQARYCSGCGNRLEHAPDSVPVCKGPTPVARRRNVVATAALVMTTLTCAAGGVAYWAASRTPSFDGVAVQRPLMSSDAQVAHAAPFDTAARNNSGSATVMLNQTTPLDAAPPQPTDHPNSRTASRLADAKSVPVAASPPVSKAAPKRERHHMLSPRAASRHASVRRKAAPEPRALDIAYQQLSGAQCAGGAAGLFCREKLRFRLCKERWTQSDVPGMSVCRVVAHAAPLS